MSLSLLGKYGTKKRRPSHNLSRPVLSPASALRSLSSVALSSVQASKTLSQNLSKIPESVNFLFDTLSGFYYESTNQLSSGFYFEATGPLNHRKTPMPVFAKLCDWLSCGAFNEDFLAKIKNHSSDDQV